MKIKHLFDEATFTLTYIVFDETSKDAIIIDPVLDFDPASGAVIIPKPVNLWMLSIGSYHKI